VTIVRVWILAAMGLFALPCVRPTCCWWERGEDGFLFDYSKVRWPTDAQGNML